MQNRQKRVYKADFFVRYQGESEYGSEDCSCE